MDGVVTWIHSDHLHSATILTDDSGTEIRRLAYRAFGEELENQGSGTEPKYSYTGKERDASGLMYYGARYYDPALSRFITPDTVYDRGPQGLNRYAYALNNPIRYNDPSGHAVDSPQYFCESPYDLLPYAGEIDSGNDVVDYAGAVVGGMYNFGAGLVNAVLGGAAAGEELVEAGYNAGTEAVIGSEGFTGEGLEGDLFALEASGLPVGASIAQGIKHSAPLFKGKVAETTKKTANAMKKLFGGKFDASNLPATVLPEGTLTATEVTETHEIAKKYNTTIDAVGSRSAGQGRNINTNFQVGKGDYSRSDIDFRIDTQHSLVDELMKELNEVGNGAGNASLKHGIDHRPTVRPFIRFTPEKVILENDKVWRIR